MPLMPLARCPPLTPLAPLAHCPPLTPLARCPLPHQQPRKC
jgi:hypothetical protein